MAVEAAFDQAALMRRTRQLANALRDCQRLLREPSVTRSEIEARIEAALRVEERWSA